MFSTAISIGARSWHVDLAAEISHLLDERIEPYRQTAHQELETDGLAFPEITTGIIESARYFFANL